MEMMEIKNKNGNKHTFKYIRVCKNVQHVAVNKD